MAPAGLNGWKREQHPSLFAVAALQPGFRMKVFQESVETVVMNRIDWKSTALERTVGVRRTLRTQAIILGTIVAALWLIEVFDAAFLRGALDGYGIQPRTLASLPAIFVAPLLHSGFGHLLANTIPLIILGWLVMLRRTEDFFIASAVALMASGLGIWLFGGANSIHIGISGIVFGLFGFLLARAFYERSVLAITLAVVAFLFYGGMLWGVLPVQSGVSWQGHLFGFAGGVLAGYWLVKRRVRTTQPVPWQRNGVQRS